MRHQTRKLKRMNAMLSTKKASKKQSFKWRGCFRMCFRDFMPQKHVSREHTKCAVRLPILMRKSTAWMFRWSVNGNGKLINIYSHIVLGHDERHTTSIRKKGNLNCNKKETQNLVPSDPTKEWKSEKQTHIYRFSHISSSSSRTQLLALNFYGSFSRENGVLNMQISSFKSPWRIKSAQNHWWRKQANPRRTINSLLFQKSRKGSWLRFLSADKDATVIEYIDTRVGLRVIRAKFSTTQLTQKATLKPTSILLIKPIAAVVWRWSLIFHATFSLCFSHLLFYALLSCFTFFFLHPRLVTAEREKSQEEK